MMKMLLCIFASFFLLSTGLYADKMVDSATKESFPDEVSFEANGKHYDLQGTGVTTRKVFFFNIYSVASYLQKGAEKSPGNKIQRIMSDKYAKQLTLKWVRNITPEEVQKGFRDAFKKAVSEEESHALEDDIHQFIHFFHQGIKAGDETILRWIPEGTIEVLSNGKKVGTIKNKHFAEDLWKIWFGPHSVVTKNDLVAKMTGTNS